MQRKNDKGKIINSKHTDLVPILPGEPHAKNKTTPQNIYVYIYL